MQGEPGTPSLQTHIANAVLTVRISPQGFHFTWSLTSRQDGVTDAQWHAVQRATRVDQGQQIPGACLPALLDTASDGDVVPPEVRMLSHDGEGRFRRPGRHLGTMDE
jgi:hypothetical protein